MGTVLVTGAAGFIGFHVAQRLLARGERVVGVDNLSDYYSVDLKRARLDILQEHKRFDSHEIDIADEQCLVRIFEEEKPTRVVHLAAQAGVRYSLSKPMAYVHTNLVGFATLLEACRHHGVEHLVYASSSSVYGTNGKVPFSVEDPVDHPVSLYAATKKSNELMAHTYSHLFNLPTTGLRFFTVYGPWGRPDMALFLFTQAILEGRPIDVYNHGRMRRDFTYVDDVAEGVVQALDRAPAPDPSFDPRNPSPASSSAPYRVYNIGNSRPVELIEFIRLLEDTLGRNAELNMLPLQPGDVLETYADVSALQRDVDYRPSTPIEVGVPKFVEWYRSFYNV